MGYNISEGVTTMQPVRIDSLNHVAMVTMVDDKITGPGPDKTPISIFEV